MNFFNVVTLIWASTAFVVGVSLILEVASIKADQALLKEQGLNGAMKNLLHRDLILVSVRCSMAFCFATLGILVLVASGTPLTRTAFSITLILCVVALVVNTRTDRASRAKITNGESK